ncbi:hypothetical protein [Thermocrispum municipale]|jgi:hypothetical protein|uniref:hypothetical protein n=1 Tax=Thermocrispum municipale TaxID=37926 RepID=UPI0012EC1075|nr:hypothetical protein [Thermocrispum municipale]
MRSRKVAKRAGVVATAGAIAAGGMLAGATPAMAAELPGPGVMRVCEFVDFDVWVRWETPAYLPWNFRFLERWGDGCQDLHFHLNDPATITVFKDSVTGPVLAKSDDYDPTRGATVVVKGDRHHPVVRIYT